MGHGHVTPNPNGSKARCGGPALCSKCAQELAQLQRIQATGQKIAEVIDEAHQSPLSPEVWEAQSLSDSALNGYSNVQLQGMVRAMMARVAELTQYNGEKDERVRELVAVEKGLHARVAELEARLASLETPQEPPVVVSGGDSAPEYAGMPWEGRP